jgi:hypothetical protein
MKVTFLCLNLASGQSLSYNCSMCTDLMYVLS